MMRAVLSFFSLLAFGAMTATAIVALMPWLSGRVAGGAVAAGPATLHFESLLLGIVFGLFLGTLTRLNWADFPRRLVTWFLVRERQFFYYTLIVGCLAVLLFY